MCWNDSVNMLAAMQDDKFVVWYHPAVIYSDKDLLPHIRFTKEGSVDLVVGFVAFVVVIDDVFIFVDIVVDLGAFADHFVDIFDVCSDFSKSPQLLQFTGHHCNLRRSDGALLATSVTPFSVLLHQHANAGHWDAAVRLCRFAKVNL